MNGIGATLAKTQNCIEGVLAYARKIKLMKTFNKIQRNFDAANHEHLHVLLSRSQSLMYLLD